MMWIVFLEPPKLFGTAFWNITWCLQQWRRYMKDIYYLHKNHAKYYYLQKKNPSKIPSSLTRSCGPVALMDFFRG